MTARVFRIKFNQAILVFDIHEDAALGIQRRLLREAREPYRADDPSGAAEQSATKENVSRSVAGWR